MVLLYELLLCGGMLCSLLADVALMHLPDNWRWMVGLPVVPAAVLASGCAYLCLSIGCLTIVTYCMAICNTRGLPVIPAALPRVGSTRSKSASVAEVQHVSVSCVASLQAVYTGVNDDMQCTMVSYLVSTLSIASWTHGVIHLVTLLLGCSLAIHSARVSALVGGEWTPGHGFGCHPSSLH